MVICGSVPPHLRGAIVRLLAALSLGCAGLRTEEPLTAAVDLTSQAEEACRSEDVETEERLWLQSLALRRETLGSSHPDLLQDHANLAALYFNLGRWPESEEHERRRLAILEAHRPADDALRAEIHAGLGWNRFKQARYVDAAAEAARAQSALDSAKSPDPAIEVMVLGLQGELMRIQDRFDDAEASFRKAADIAHREIGDTDPWTLDQRNNLAGLLKDRGRLGEAEELLAGIFAVQTKKPEEFQSSLPTVYLNRAEILRLQGRIDEAQPLYEKALELAGEALCDDPELAIFHNQLAVLHAEAGRFTEAERHYHEGLEVAREALENQGHPLVAQGHHDLARLRREVGDLAGAEELYRQAISMRERSFGAGHPEVAWSMTDLARTLYLAGGARDVEALALVERAIEVLESSTAYPQVLAEAYAVRADLLDRAGDRAGAVAMIEEAIELVEDLRPISGGEAARAELLGRYAGYYDRMVGWQVAGGRPAEAFRWSERGRARVLLEQLALAGVDLRSAIDASVLGPLEDEERRLKLAIAEAQAELARLSGLAAMGGVEGSDRRQVERLATLVRTVRGVEGQIRRSSPLRAGVASESATLTAAEAARRLLGERERLLSYQIGEAGSVALLLSPFPRPAQAWPLSIDGESAALLGVAPGPLTQATLDRLVAEGIGRLGIGSLAAPASGPAVPTPRKGPTDLDSILHGLFRVLVPAELWPELVDAEAAILIPDGALHELPFETLVVNDPGGGETRYWLDEGPAVRYAPSATVLAHLGGGEGQAGALVVADPIFDPSAAAVARVAALAAAPVPARPDEASGPSAGVTRTRERAAGRLGPLPGTAVEAREIEEVLRAGGTTVEVLQRLDAEEQRVRESLGRGPRLVHFATHGVVEEGSNELLAALVLTPPPGTAEPTTDSDGLLQLFEIYALNLPADLVVLSACQTHRGRRLDGEGVFALSRGFLAAGARRVIASQWPVDDASTAVLMRELYRRMVPGGGLAEGRVSQALRDAKRALRADPRWQSPYYWGGFVMIGRD